MCFGGGGSKAMEEEARRAREEEERRQAEIRQGRNNINAIFDGGYIQDGPVTARQNTGLFPNLNGALQEAVGAAGPLIAKERNARTGAFGSLVDLFGGLVGAINPQGGATNPQGRRVEGFATDEFFANNRQAFMDYALPQLDRQFGDASRDLTFDLSRSGLRNSSVRGQQSGRLQELYDRNMQQVTNEALSREQQQRTSIEDSRANLIAMLQTTGDAQGATNQALSRAAILSQPQPFSPLGQMFTDFTAGLGTQAAMERAASVSGGRFQPRYNTGLFGTPTNAVQNRR
jgi:hypothetical protein